ncbi:GntR family transcriptional regulator [Carnobacteriaceae bacterium zg-ZUI252]|nr:GntR family transcriptional regulator [Carnobacteriaceae bacterium zg-ZUI252]MBS4769601.1 GntR family transcriptional regulator [Carnobacteriaceae bacterium zg-ZUI240]QTU83062.1 GntR family transcriptional regulator [Carnobacteriaceae bacterium zg-C25]
MKIPKYLQIKFDLQKQIQSGQFESGDRFYTEAEIIKKYSVSSITAIRALNELTQDGYIVRHQGKGSFVSRARKNKLVQFSDIEKFTLNKETVEVLAITKEQQPNYVKKLELHEDASYYHVERLRRQDNEPFLYQNTYLAPKYVKHDISDLDAFASIYRRFRLDFDIHMNDEYSIETNEIVFPVPEQVKNHLQLKDTEPAILQIKKTISRSDNSVLEYIESYKHWNYYKIEIVSNANG